MIKTGFLFAVYCFAVLSICLAYDDEDPLATFARAPGPLPLRCPSYRPHHRLGICYKGYEQPQADADDVSTLPTGHNFIIYGRSASSHSYYGSHISVFKLKPHIYSSTIDISLLDSHCVRHADDLLKLITDESQALLFKYNDTAIKLVDVVNKESNFYMYVDQVFTTDYPSSIRCKVNIRKVMDLRRYHQTTPQPDFPKHAHWLIFGHVISGYRSMQTHYYMERIPLKCKDIHQLLEIHPVPNAESFNLPQYLIGSASVILLKEIPGEPSLNAAGIPKDPIVLGQKYEAVSLEKNPLTGEHTKFSVYVKRKVSVDVNIINIGCP